MAARILIIEDEPAIADTLVYALTTDGFETVWCATGDEGLGKLRQSAFELVLLDVGLPDINGFDLFRQIQKQWTMPVIFLTARNGEIDRVVGLELGADDYISKPFSPREVCARVRTVLRRMQRAAQQAMPGSMPEKAVGSQPFEVDDLKKTIRFYGRSLDLSRTEYRLLKTLVRHPGRVYSREELMEQAWEHPEVSLDRTVDAHIKQLRAKLREVSSEADPIQTHRGMGYSLKEQA